MHNFLSLIQVTLDIGEERNTGQPRAFPVEQCACPVGYRGLSCEDCDVGYTRDNGGLYLGFCELCSCNGFSEECDPETGDCFVSFYIMNVHFLFLVINVFYT